MINTFWTIYNFADTYIFMNLSSIHKLSGFQVSRSGWHLLFSDFKFLDFEYLFFDLKNWKLKQNQHNVLLFPQNAFFVSHFLKSSFEKCFPVSDFFWYQHFFQCQNFFKIPKNIFQYQKFLPCIGASYHISFRLWASSEMHIRAG